MLLRKVDVTTFAAGAACLLALVIAGCDDSPRSRCVTYTVATPAERPAAPSQPARANVDQIPLPDPAPGINSGPTR